MKATLLIFLFYSCLLFAGGVRTLCTSDLLDFSSDRRILENIRIASRGQTDPAVQLWFDAFDSYFGENGRPDKISFETTPAITRVIERINDLDMSFHSNAMIDEQPGNVAYLTGLFERERAALNRPGRVNYYNLFRTAQIYAILNSGNQLPALTEAFHTSPTTVAGMWRMSLKTRTSQFRHSGRFPLQVQGEFTNAPWVFMVPTAEKLQFHDFTPLYPYPIYRAAVAEDFEWGDGTPFSSHEGLKHDISHARAMFANRRDVKIGHQEPEAMQKELYRIKAGLALGKKFDRKRKALSTRQQKLADLMWVHLFHERYVRYTKQELRNHKRHVSSDDEVIRIKERVNVEHDYALGFEKVPTEEEIRWAVEWVRKNF